MGSYKCENPGCTNPATMECPTCIKLSLPKSHYCAQKCFAAHWPKHKELHKLAKSIGQGKVGQKKQRVNVGEDVYAGNFQGFEFPGKLRPSPITPTRELPRSIGRPDYADHPEGRSACEEDLRRSSTIPVYTPEEISGIREACRIGREVLDLAGQAVRVGVTTDEIDRIAHEACVERNCYPSPLNYYNFPKSVCTSVNEIICHGIPDTRELQDGDIVNIDVTTYVNGYHGDLNETFLVGNVDEDGRRIVKTAFECLSQAINLVQPGTLYRDIGKAVQSVAHANKCQVVRTYCGHGIGSLFHTVPVVPHYAKNKAKGIMKAGNIFTIEPMINLGTWRDITWPDNWTSSTADGARSAQFEHTILVTEDGYEFLTGRLDEPAMDVDNCLKYMQRGL